MLAGHYNAERRSKARFTVYVLRIMDKGKGKGEIQDPESRGLVLILRNT